jgi:hypothetical protein
MASLSSRPWPLSPTWVTLRPSRRSSGWAVWNPSSGPPTIIARVPLSAAGTLPDTGASIMMAPTARTRRARSRLARGLTVLMST